MPQTNPVESLLDKITRPGDLRALSTDELEMLAAEIRSRIIETVSRNGGHLASPLGVVDLTLALYRVFDLERDKIVWDVGHQSYAHKLVTGRQEQFNTIRTKGGLSGYPKRSESPYDCFGVGHSSTSISAALGIAMGRDLKRLPEQQEPERVIAVIGDGAMTGGMAMEALSHAGHLATDLLVILNDNRMSISPNVGALSSYFSRIITDSRYKRAREDVTSFVKRILSDRMRYTAHRFEQAVKEFLTDGGLFQDLGFNYVGPVDGHDIPALVGLFSNIQKMHGPILFHCVTQKGRGYPEAEDDPQKFHGVKPRDVRRRETEGEARPPEKVDAAVPIAKAFTDVFAETLIECAKEDPSIVAITAAMPSGTGLNRFQEVFPKRFFDVGICEQHAVTFAAGLAVQNMKPVCAIYSTFFQRAYDQFVHDVCLQNLPVVFALDRGGLVGEDSPTHTGAFDISFLRVIPNVTVLAPRDDIDLARMLKWACQHQGPVVIRYPRDVAHTIQFTEDAERGDCTCGEILREGTDATLLALGPCAGVCLDAAELLQTQGYSVRVADARSVKPLDAALLDRISDRPIITVEENALQGGFGSAVLEYFEQCGRFSEVHIRRIGLPDVFGDHASRSEQLAEVGLVPSAIAKIVCAEVGKCVSPCSPLA